MNKSLSVPSKTSPHSHLKAPTFDGESARGRRIIHNFEITEEVMSEDEQNDYDSLNEKL